MADVPCPCQCTPLPAHGGNRPWVRAAVDPGPARPGEAERLGEDLFELGIAIDASADVADDAAQIGLELAQASVGTLELLGMGIALMLDQRQLADPRIGLAQLDTGMRGKSYQALARSV